MKLPLARWVRAPLAFVALGIAASNMARPLANPDEGRYSEISREMAASGDWVTPRLNGIKYFEKPPLQYWATAAAFEVFGVNEFAARLYLLACGLATILLVGFLDHRLGIVVFLAIAAPWFFLVSRANPEFAEFFFFHEHFSRFLTQAHRRVEPWWYFVPIVIFGFLPWMFALPSAIARAWKS